MIQSYIDHLINVLNEKSNYFYVIRYKKRTPREWYFMDMEKIDPLKVIWVPSFRAAFRFSTEELVEDFKAHWLRRRPVEIVRMEKQ